MRQLRAAASFAPPPPVSRPGIPPRHFGEAPPPPAAPPFLEASPIAPKVRRPPAGRQRPQKQLRRSRQLCAAAAQLRAPAPRPSFGRRARSAAAASPAPRPAAAASCRSPTLSPAAGHERDRARFSPRTPANTGRPKLPPRKSPRPSPPCALMSADRRTWPQRRLARGRLEKSNGCKPATPDPPIDHSNIEVPAVNRGHRSCASPQHPASAGPPHRRTAAPQHRSTAVVAAPPYPAFRHTAAPHLDNFTSPLTRASRLYVLTSFTGKSSATPASPVNRSSPSIRPSRQKRHDRASQAGHRWGSPKATRPRVPHCSAG